MTSFTWKKGAAGNWNDIANWQGNIVPNEPNADVSILAPPVGNPGFYNVTIAAGASETVHSLDLGSSNIGLEVDGTLSFAPGSAGGLGREFQSSLLAVNNGTIVNAGTVFAFIQTKGNVLFEGTTPIYLAWELQVLDGTATVDTTSIAQYAGQTLSDGAFDALGPTEVINLGGKLGGLSVDVETLTGPKPTPTQSYWTQLIYNDAGSQINEWNGTTYVPIESTLKLIENAAYVTVTDGRNYTTANAFTIGKDGVFEQAGGTLSTGGLTLLNGGLLVGGVSITGPGPTSGRVVVDGAVTNGGQIVAEGPGIVFHDTISGTGEITFNRTAPLPGIGTSVGPAVAGTLEVAGVGSGQTLKMIGNDTLILDNPAAFAGTISGFAGGDRIVLDNTHVTREVYTPTGAATGTLDLFDGSTKVDSLSLAGSYTGQTFSFGQTSTGGSVVTLLTETLFSATSTSGIDKITSNPRLIGSGNPNAAVTLTEKGTLFGRATADATGAWSVALPQLAGGQHTVVASEQDGAGNTGTTSLIFAVVAVPAPVAGVSTLQVSSTDLAKSLQGNGFLQFAGGTETILLADGRLSVGPDTDEAFVTRLYQGLLGRTPDANGLASWDAALKVSGKAAVAQSFLNSGEYQNAHPAPTADQFINNLYQGMLGRPADAGGLASWKQALAGGMSRGQVAAAFADSTEGKQHWSGATSGGVFARDPNAAIVREDYYAAFGREADTGGLSSWTQFLNSGGTSGQLAQDFTMSPEFQTRHGQQTNAQYVASIYQDGLGRAVDPAGADSWGKALQSGATRADVLAGIAQSPEAQHHLQWALA